MKIINNNIKTMNLFNILKIYFIGITIPFVILSLSTPTYGQINSAFSTGVNNSSSKVESGSTKSTKSLQDFDPNTNTWEISGSSSWQDLQNYLPTAKMDGIPVLISLLAPSQCPPINPSGSYSEPYRLDFVTWAQEIAKLSLRYSNLKGYTIENLQQNLDQGYLTQNYINDVKTEGTSINPKLQFIQPKSYHLWYVDRDVSGGTGSADSWANAVKSIHALPNASIADGDSVYVSGGSDSTLYLDDYISGLTANCIITQGKDTGHNGDVYFSTRSSTYNMFLIKNSSNFEMSNFTFTTDGVDSSKTVDYLLMSDNSSNVTIAHCNILSPHGNGASVRWGTGLGMVLSYDSIIISQNWRPEGTWETDNIQFYNSSGGNIVDHCYIENRDMNGGTSVDMIQWIFCGNSNDYLTQITNNVFVANGATIHAAIYTSSMYSNRILIANNIFMSLSVPESYSEIYLDANRGDSYDHRVYVLNNTIYDNGKFSYPINVSPNLDTLLIENNIIYTNSNYILRMLSGTMATVDYKVVNYNRYYHNGGSCYFYENGGARTFSTWQGNGYDANSSTSSFSFDKAGGTSISDYTPDFSNTGTDLHEYFRNDILMNDRPKSSGWDMGAIEQ